MRHLLAALHVLVLSGCSAFGLGSGLSVEARPPTLVLDNELSRTVYYVAIEANDAALVDLNPGVRQWPRLEARQSLEIPYARLDGYDEGDTTAIVYWSTGTGYERVVVRL